VNINRSKTSYQFYFISLGHNIAKKVRVPNSSLRNGFIKPICSLPALWLFLNPLNNGIQIL